MKELRPAPRRTSGHSGGFTLIEALFMIAIVTIGMAAVMYLMAVSETMNLDSRQTTTAYAAANDLMEYFRQQPFANLTVATNTTFGTTAPSTGGQAATPSQVGYNNLKQLPNAAGTYTIADYQGNTDIVQVTVTVAWSRHSAARDASISITTLIAQNGINERWK